MNLNEYIKSLGIENEAINDSVEFIIKYYDSSVIDLVDSIKRMSGESGLNERDGAIYAVGLLLGQLAGIANRN